MDPVSAALPQILQRIFVATLTRWVPEELQRVHGREKGFEGDGNRGRTKPFAQLKFWDGLFQPNQSKGLALFF